MKTALFSTDLPTVRDRFAHLQLRLSDAGLAVRAPPPEPTTCCGRGCNGCVWDGFYAAAAWWCEDAAEALDRPAAAGCQPSSDTPPQPMHRNASLGYHL